MEKLDLKKTLQKVDEFAGVLTLNELQNEVLGREKLSDLDKDKDFLNFTHEILIIKEKVVKNYAPTDEKQSEFSLFIKKIQSLRGSQNLSIHDIISQTFPEWPDNCVQKKGLEYGEAKSFNVPLRLLISENFEKLLGYLGNVAFQTQISEGILLKQEKTTFWQITGRTLEYHFEEMKKRKRERPSSPNRDKNKKKIQGRKVGGNRRAYFKDFVNRNHMLYCLHSNKKPGMFKKNLVESLANDLRTIEKKKGILTKDEQKECQLDLGEKLMNNIFEDISLPTSEGRFQFRHIASCMIQKYSNLNIERIFKKHCPKSPIYSEIKTEVDEFLKEKIQVSDVKISEFLSKLVKLDIGVRKVENFIIDILGKTLPVDLFGKANHFIVLDHIKKLITMKKFEVMAYNEVMKTLKFSEIPWLNSRKTKKMHLGSKVVDNKLIIREQLTWLFNKFVTEIIRSNFYVTEKHNEHNKLFFYTKPVWFLITRVSMANLENMNLDKFNANEEYKDHNALPQQTQSIKYSNLNKQGYASNTQQGNPFNLIRKEERFENIPTAKLRQVPKSDSVRPIMTFYRKFREPKTGKLTKVGMYLANAKIVLRSFKRTLGQSLGYAVFDNYQIFNRYADYKQKWLENGSPNLHYLTMDISKCYDSVDLSRLFDLQREEEIFKEFYLITRFHKVIRNRRFVFRRTKDGDKDKVPLSSLFILKTKDTALPFSEIDDLEKYTQDDIIKDGKTVYIDIPYKTVITKEEILESINVVCKKIVVKLGKSNFKLKKGLPQGLSISSVLSSFYYACIEYKATRYIEGDRFNIHKRLSLIMRLTDDYLVQTDHEDCARNFIKDLLNCADENSFQFNKKKLTTSFNFTHDNENDVVAGDPDVCKWIGKIIYPRNLELEHTQIFDEKTAFFTVSTNISQFDKYPAQVIKAKMKSFILNHNLFYQDPKINSVAKIMKILTNIVNSSYLKIKLFIDRILKEEPTGEKPTKRKSKSSGSSPLGKAQPIKNNSHEIWIGRKFYEAMIDCACSVFTIIEESSTLDQKQKNELLKSLYDHIVNTFLENLSKDKNSAKKRTLCHIMKKRIEVRNISNWLNGNEKIVIIN